MHQPKFCDRSPPTNDDHARTMLASIRRRIDVLSLDLGGLHVVTEAATGPYACTASIAAIAGARVSVFARDTRHHGTARNAVDETLGLADLAGVSDRIAVLDRLEPSKLNTCDILTNSGHLRPISGAMIQSLPPQAVIALMFEAWEFREADFDLEACRDRGIRIAAVNERHPDVAVFPFLGPLCVRMLLEAGVPTEGRRILVLCDNLFAPFLVAGLENAGAQVTLCRRIIQAPVGPWDSVVVALDPARNPPLDLRKFDHLIPAAPKATLAQFWGDVDRASATVAGFTVVPDREPPQGHMGILLNALGHEPIVRLQTGSLKAAEIVLRGKILLPDGVAELL